MNKFGSKKTMVRGFTPLERLKSIRQDFSNYLGITNNDSLTGFTLIETIAAIFIFAILMLIIGSTFIQFLSLQRRASNLQQIIENAYTVLDAVTKEIRVANVTTADTGSNCGTPSSTLDFSHPVNGNISYSLGADNNFHRIVGGSDTILNSAAVEFTNLKFCILKGTNLQPRITVIASMRTKNIRDQESMDIQTTLSQRFIPD